MLISEAVKKAMEQRKEIYRTSVRRKTGYCEICIKPTNSYNACILVIYKNGKEEKSCRNWNPTGDDLVADDWEITG